MLIFIFVSSKETKWCFLICFPCIKKKYMSNILKEISLYHFTSISVSVLHWIFPITYWGNGKKGQWNVRNTHRKHMYKGTLFFFYMENCHWIKGKNYRHKPVDSLTIIFHIVQLPVFLPFYRGKGGEGRFQVFKFCLL